jgi:hypothetical protein
MGKHYRYYLGRITKGGVLTTEEVIEAIIKPVTIHKNKYSYTFANMSFNKDKNYVFGKLVKFLPEGEVDTIEPVKHEESFVLVPHKIQSSSPFIIVLDYMGIAYPTVWNELTEEQFETNFRDLIKQKFDDFFVDCKIEAVVDLRTFVDRLSSMDRIDKIRATVMPPNPLFGPAWKDLKEYMERRKTGEVSISEKAKTENGLITNIKSIMKGFFEDKENKLEHKSYDISDAALLMAADGYGHAKVEGKSDGSNLVIKTKDNQKSFQFDKTPDIEEFFELVKKKFEAINNERDLQH